MDSRSETPTALVASGPGEPNGVEEPVQPKSHRKPVDPHPLRKEGSLTLALRKNEDLEDDDKPATEAGVTRPDRGRKVQFPRRAPVVDAQTAQAQVPLGPYDRILRPPSPSHPEVQLVWTGELTPEVISYLAFCRQLVGKGDIPVSEPLEDDEQALEFLQQQGGNDVERAKLLLLSSMGGGAELASITLSQDRESKTRPRVKGTFRSWVGGEYRNAEGAESLSMSEVALNHGKLKGMWKDWSGRCKKTLSLPQITAQDLLALQREERQLPRLQSRGGQDDDAIITAANDVSCDLDTRIRDVEIFIADVHDALSFVNPGKRLTTAELKRLADDAPKRMQLKEVEILRDLIAKSENWERRAQRWLHEEDESAPLTTNPKSRSRGAGSAGLSSVSTQQEFTVAALSELIREGEQMCVDNSATLGALTKKKHDCETIVRRLATHVPHEKSWKLNKKKYEVLTLSQLKQLRDDVKRMKLKLPHTAVLDSHISMAEKWNADVVSCATERRSVKDLTSLLAKADQIPVDLTGEKKALEKFLERAVDWIKRAKAFFPPTRSQAVVVGTSKKTRAALMAEDSIPFEKGSSTDFLALRDEAVSEGLDTLREASDALEAAEKVEDWIARVNEAMREITDDKLDLLNALLSEAENLPVIVPEEQALRTSAMMKNWSRTASRLIAAESGTVPLSDFERALISADRLFPADPGTNKRKKVKRTTILENEVELRSCVEEARRWVESANRLLQPSVSGEKFNSYKELSDLIQQHIQANVDEARVEVFRKLHEIAKWQAQVREKLLTIGAVSAEELTSKETCDSLLQMFKQDPSAIMAAEQVVEEEESAGARMTNGNDDKKMQVLTSVISDGGSSKLSLESLKNLLTEAQRIGVITPELNILTSLDARVKEWLNRVAVVAPDPAAAPSSTSKRKKRKHGGEDLPSNARLALQEEDLIEMKRQGEALPVDVSARLADLDACLSATVEWRELCQGPLDMYRKCCADAGSASIPEQLTPLDGPLLGILRVVVLDDQGKEQFPSVREENCAWWKDEYEEDVRQAVQGIVDAMKEAEQRKLHLVALDSSPVRACSWLIQADLWLQDVRKEFLIPTSPPTPKSLLALCQTVLNGRKLVMTSQEEDADVLPESFPEEVLEEYTYVVPPNSVATGSSTSALPQAKRTRQSTAAMQPPAAIVSAPPPVITATVGEEDDKASLLTGDGAGGATDVSPSSPRSSPISLGDEWRILRFSKEVRASEAEGSSDIHSGSLTGLIHKRLFGLERAAQAAFASRGLARRLGQVPRKERSLSKLKELTAQTADWSTAFVVAEDPRFKHELSVAEAWMEDRRKTWDSRKGSVEQLEKLASRGEKLWVDFVHVERLREEAKKVRDWLDRFAKSGVESAENSLSADELRLLLEEGKKLRGVNLEQQIGMLKKATEVFCMCRGGPEEPMMVCVDCQESFHRACIKDFSNEVCPVCTAVRAVQRTVGFGYAAVCRVQALREMGDIIVPDPERRAMLLDWFAKIEPFLLSDRIETTDSATLKDEFIDPPAELTTTLEVEAVIMCILARRWRSKLERLRHRPSLEDLVSVLDSLPTGVAPECREALQSIRERGHQQLETFAEIWNLPEDTPSEEVVRRCRKSLDLLEWIPLDMSGLQKTLVACEADNGQRHCVCNRFDDGSVMLACSRCEKWFHSRCVGVTTELGTSQDYYCPKCVAEGAGGGPVPTETKFPDTVVMSSASSAE